MGVFLHIYTKTTTTQPGYISTTCAVWCQPEASPAIIYGYTLTFHVVVKMFGIKTMPVPLIQL